MEIRQLEYFVAVAEMGGFTRAAEVCHVVQTTVSHAVATLERELGVRLLDRTGRTVELTPEGRVFLDDARVIVERTHQAERHLQTYHELGESAVRIGYYGAGLAEDFPETVRRFHGETGRKVILKGADADASSEDLTVQVRKGALDAYIIAHAPIPEHDAWATQRVVAYNGVYLAMAPNDPLAVPGTISRSDLSEVASTICMFRASHSDEYRAAMRSWLSDGFGIDSSAVSWNDSLEDVRLLARCGQCRTISFCNSDLASFYKEGLMFRRIEGLGLLPITMVWRKAGARPDIELFAEIARRVSTEHGIDVARTESPGSDAV